jgi:protein-tyrosine phosphatase
VTPVSTTEAADPADAAPADRDGTVGVLALCTGNAARSVMAGVMLASDRLRVTTAGTHVVEGRPMSYRTRDALAAVGLSADGHRSHQLTDHDIEAADLVLAMAGDHVAYIRRRHPEAAAKTATIKRLCRDLPDGPSPLGERLAALGLAHVAIEPWEDVDDPAGMDDEDYVACAEELAVLCAELSTRLA